MPTVFQRGNAGTDELLAEVSYLRRRVAELEGESPGIEEALRKSEERYRAVAETAFAGISITDAKENIVYANPAFAQMLGHAEGELLGVNLSNLTRPDEFSRFQRLTEQRQRGVCNHYETHLYRRDRSIIAALVSASPLTARDGSFEGTLAVVLDISESKRVQRELQTAKEAYTERLEDMVDERTRELKVTQAQLIHSEKMASLGNLAAGVAHEINNPTGVLLMKLKFLLSIADSEQLSQKTISSLEVAVQQIDRIARITESLLSFSRQDQGTPVEIDLNKTIETAVILSELAFSSQKIEVSVSLDPDLPKVLADPTDLEQVVINLLSNAVDAMPEGGRLAVATRADGSAGSRVVFTVTDTGNGIPEEHMGRIFDPFFTTKEVGKGTGLGLSVSFGVIEKLGGHIAVESDREVGTSFTIRLPADGNIGS
jgi:PAS domain S-box-containing protein